MLSRRGPAGERDCDLPEPEGQDYRDAVVLLNGQARHPQQGGLVYYAVRRKIIGMPTKIDSLRKSAGDPIAAFRCADPSRANGPVKDSAQVENRFANGGLEVPRGFGSMRGLTYHTDVEFWSVIYPIEPG